MIKFINMVPTLDIFLSRRPIFWSLKFVCAPDQARQKMGAQNQNG